MQNSGLVRAADSGIDLRYIPKPNFAFTGPVRKEGSRCLLRGRVSSLWGMEPGFIHPFLIPAKDRRLPVKE
jgi:hypothetical protein